jgi:hypothetical protein
MTALPLPKPGATVVWRRPGARRDSVATLRRFAPGGTLEVVGPGGFASVAPSSVKRIKG